MHFMTYHPDADVRVPVPAADLAWAYRRTHRRQAIALAALVALAAVTVVQTIRVVSEAVTAVPVPVSAWTLPVDPSAAEDVKQFAAAITADGYAVTDGMNEFDGFVIAFDDLDADGTWDADDEPVLSAIPGMTGQ